ncbi:hypothetical protein [Schlesneria sp. DSM 10557]|uniref:hypothetical protein n=1 Tax=Schlesneria sp. DSM 10557 TaxID=3044399 RepID=UPI00359F8F0D
MSKLEQGLDAQQICLNLVQEHGSDEKYGSVRRFVKSLGIWYAVSPGAFSQGGKYRQLPPVDADGNFEPQGKLCLIQPRAADAAPVAAMTRQPGLPSQGAIPLIEDRRTRLDRRGIDTSNFEFAQTQKS